MTSQAAEKASPKALKTGDKAPVFTLTTDGGGSVSLEKLKGQNVVLYFYPKDDTPGCTIEAKDFRDLMKDFEKSGTVIIGLSRDDVKSHDAFKEKFCLPFTLASDEDGKVCEAYGVWVEKSMYGKKYMGIERATFLIDKHGKIAHVWPKVKVEGHAKEVLEAVKGLK
jgi:thioredoxin-dependent peroxiredoxin